LVIGAEPARCLTRPDACSICHDPTTSSTLPALPVAQLLDVVAPAIPVAQAIGRLGNWFNQELFGRPTRLPWGLHISPDHRPPGLEHVTTYDPTFLYEALWNLALAACLVLYERHRPNARPGRLFALYVAGYALGRLWVEALRIDPASRIAGLRVNIWTRIVTLVITVAWPWRPGIGPRAPNPAPPASGPTSTQPARPSGPD
jgi:prolipoprotein diacylglyceryl transferase